MDICSCWMTVGMCAVYVLGVVVIAVVFVKAVTK